MIPRCVECGGVWLPADEERWQAWLTCDEPPELAFYCPECGEREFSSPSSSWRSCPRESDLAHRGDEGYQQEERCADQEIDNPTC